MNTKSTRVGRGLGPGTGECIYEHRVDNTRTRSVEGEEYEHREEVWEGEGPGKETI